VDATRTYTRSGLARLLGLSARTLKRWEETGRLVANRWPSGRPFYSQIQVDDLLSKRVTMPPSCNADTINLNHPSVPTSE
jgi:hypothetical protein